MAERDKRTMGEEGWKAAPSDSCIASPPLPRLCPHIRASPRLEIRTLSCRVFVTMTSRVNPPQARSVSLPSAHVVPMTDSTSYLSVRAPPRSADQFVRGQPYTHFSSIIPHFLHVFPEAKPKGRQRHRTPDERLHAISKACLRQPAHLRETTRQIQC